MRQKLNILLVYPKIPITFWSFKYALGFISKKSALPPLGLITIAAMLPPEWDQKLVDTNVSKLKDKDILWADYVFISAMNIQKNSALNIIERCKSLQTKIVAGGPMFTTDHENFEGIDFFVLNEGEITLQQFIKDLTSSSPEAVYTTIDHANMADSPPPRIDLLQLSKYASMSLQYSRGCPYNCEFCDITLLYGHKVRTKSKDQLIHELDCLYNAGWRDSVFIVDDNFIGNKSKLTQEILPAMINWMKAHRYPFRFNTQTSIELADNENLMELMVNAGFRTVFIGIESPDEDSLAECNKNQNIKRDLIASVHKMYQYGLAVQGGFIIGFDHDPVSIFESQIKFIQESGIVTAMVGLLNAIPKTPLYNRMVREKRIVEDFSGDNTNASINFIPKMHINTLLNGYKHTMRMLYSSRKYYERLKTFLKLYHHTAPSGIHIKLIDMVALFKSFLYVGVFSRMRYDFWSLLYWTIFRKPWLLKLVILHSIYGYHFQKVMNKYMK
jgi:radical SAM superfamily enzyme YgiQ (UPF0313 family)